MEDVHCSYMISSNPKNENTGFYLILYYRQCKRFSNDKRGSVYNSKWKCSLKANHESEMNVGCINLLSRPLGIPFQ